MFDIFTCSDIISAISSSFYLLFVLYFLNLVIVLCVQAQVEKIGGKAVMRKSGANARMGLLRFIIIQEEIKRLSLIQVMDIQKPSKQEKLHTHWIMK